MRTLFTDFYQRGRGFSTEDLIRVINGVGITVRYFPSDDSVFIDDAYLISCPSCARCKAHVTKILQRA
jgi:hypothetical protein